MRKNSNFTYLEVMGKKVLACPETPDAPKPYFFVLNSTAAFMWENIKDGDFELQALVNLLMEEYGIGEDIAAPAAKEMLDRWISNGIVL